MEEWKTRKFLHWDSSEFCLFIVCLVNCYVYTCSSLVVTEPLQLISLDQKCRMVLLLALRKAVYSSDETKFLASLQLNKFNISFWTNIVWSEVSCKTLALSWFVVGSCYKLRSYLVCIWLLVDRSTRFRSAIKSQRRNAECRIKTGTKTREC